MPMAPVSGQVQTARKSNTSEFKPGMGCSSNGSNWPNRCISAISAVSARRFVDLKRAKTALLAQDAQGSGGASHLGKLALPTPDSFAKAPSRNREPGAAESNPRLCWPAAPGRRVHRERRSHVWSYPRYPLLGCPRPYWQTQPGPSTSRLARLGALILKSFCFRFAENFDEVHSSALHSEAWTFAVLLGSD
jgi:hypothetical protein